LGHNSPLRVDKWPQEGHMSVESLETLLHVPHQLIQIYINAPYANRPPNDLMVTSKSNQPIN